LRRRWNFRRGGRQRKTRRNGPSGKRKDRTWQRRSGESRKERSARGIIRGEERLAEVNMRRTRQLGTDID